MARFVDTNVLVYAEDADAGPKHEVARALILDLWEVGDGALSVQVLQEFFVTVTRKVAKPMRADRAARIVEEYTTWTVVETDVDLLRKAIGPHQRARLPFWDALVVQAAGRADCDELLTEDLDAGQRIEGVLVVNPFASS